MFIKQVYQDHEDGKFYEPLKYPAAGMSSESSAEDPQSGLVILFHVTPGAGRYEVVGAVNVLNTLLL